ncbi:hypothetical protein MMC31_004366, partial [Peltigera leucophlebia]|nr:hypothetical protein [Peltigera leucophlebia]
MDPFTISLAVAPLILSSAKLIKLASAVKDSHKTAPTTLIATLTECRVIHMTLSKIQGLVYKNESDLSSRLAAQKPLREAFDDALTGCRMTLAALNLEMDKLVEPERGTQTTGFGFRAKAKLVWKESIMKQLLDQTRGQMTSLQYLIQFLESETLADILKSLQQNLADIRRILHRTKSIRSNQGLGDDQSSFHLTHQVAAFGLVPSYEAQLSQSSTYQRAQSTAVEELVAKRIELMDEKYALEDKVEGLLLEIDLKVETVRQLEHDISTKDQRIGILERDTLNGGRLLLNEQKITELEDELALLYEVIDLKDDAIIIHKAAAKGHSRALGLLLGQGANIEALTESRSTPLHVSATLGCVKVLQMLLEKGANIEATDKKGRTPLYSAVAHGHVEIVQILLDKGANGKAEDDGRQTPLHSAAFYGKVEIVQMLLEKGGNKAVDVERETPLHIAAAYNHVEIVQMLLEKGADKEAQDEGRQTPLHSAAFYGKVEMVQMLLENGANPEAVDKEGQTPLHIAAAYNDVEIVRILLEKGANREALDRSRQTPLKIAKRE